MVEETVWLAYYGNTLAGVFETEAKAEARLDYIKPNWRDSRKVKEVEIGEGIHLQP